MANDTKTPRIARFPKDYGLFLVNASIYAMDLLEDDDYMTLNEAIDETIVASTWAVTDKGIALILKHSPRRAEGVIVASASTIPEAEQLKAGALAALHADLRHELVEECGIDASLFE